MATVLWNSHCPLVSPASAACLVTWNMSARNALTSASLDTWLAHTAHEKWSLYYIDLVIEV